MKGAVASPNAVSSHLRRDWGAGVGGGGGRGIAYGGAHLSPFTALSFADLKKVPIYCWVDGTFQSPNDKTQV